MSEKLQKGPQAVLCDMCTGEDRKPAQKTCMKCEISMCVQHLQAHLITPVLLQTHPLTEPMASGDEGLGGTTKCPRHGKLLEYYCLDDRTCVCVSCAIEDQHRLHNMKTFTTAHKELVEKLNNEQEAILVKADSQSVDLEKWEKSETKKVGHSSLRLIEAVTNLRDIALTSVQSSVSARMVSIKTSNSSIRAAQQEKDTFRFLQMYSQVHQDVQNAKAVDLWKGLEPGSDRDKLVQEIRRSGEKMVKQANEFWGSLLTLVDPKNHQELDSDLIFVPQSFGSSMSLSKDKRKVFYSGSQGQCSATLLIRSTRKDPSIQRWIISFSPDVDWTIGLRDKQSARYTDLSNGHVYSLCCKGNQLSSFTTEDDASVKSPSGFKPVDRPRVSSASVTHQGKEGNEAVPRPETVEVFWDFDSSSLSFFNRTGQHQREEIITIRKSLNNRDLAPFVKLETKNVQNMHQQDCKCQCGKGFQNHFSFVRVNQLDNSSLSYCSCGEMIGDICITEMVCELH